MRDVVEDHRRARDAFTAVVHAADATGRWDAPSPCTEWDARGVVEHVIGSHDALLLNPLGAKPTRPKDDVVARWDVTADVLARALADPEAVDEQRRGLLGVLATDVLVHTWDLASAAGVDVDLDPELCTVGYERAVANRDRLAASGMFAPPVDVNDAAPVHHKLLGMMGRDPAWTPPPR